MERVEEFKVGDWVRIRQNLTSAKHGFGSVVPGSMGIVYCVRPDSSLLVELSYLPNPWHCEPEEVEPVAPFTVIYIYGNFLQTVFTSYQKFNPTIFLMS